MNAAQLAAIAVPLLTDADFHTVDVGRGWTSLRASWFLEPGPAGPVLVLR